MTDIGSSLEPSVRTDVECAKDRGVDAPPEYARKGRVLRAEAVCLSTGELPWRGPLPF